MMLKALSAGKMGYYALALGTLMLTFISPIISQVPISTVNVTNSLGLSCQAYCVGINGAPFDAAIPSTWDGANCVNATRLFGGMPYLPVSCFAAYPEEPLLCTCTPSVQGRDGQGLGWNQVGYASDGENAWLIDSNQQPPCRATYHMREFSLDVL